MKTPTNPGRFTLLDLGLMAFDPDSRAVLISKTLAHSGYATLSGTGLKEPLQTGQRPDRAVLVGLLENFLVLEATR